jgi:diguanylate cyclase (GGDEF)-like protein
MRTAPSEDRWVRLVYLVVLAVPLVLSAAAWLLRGADDAFTRVLFPWVLVVHGLLIVGFATRRLSLRAVGPYVFLSPLLILLFRLLSWELGLSSRPEDAGIIVVVLAWFGVLCALSFLVFGTRRGAVISLAGYAIMYLGAALSASGGMLADLGLREVVGAAGAHAVLIGVVWVLARNVEQLSAARARGELLALQATTDPLTGIANRRRLDDEVERMVAEAHRYPQPLSVILIDLDHFKRVNDDHGHDAGDRVLVTTVARLWSGIRDADVLGRWGGEEFLLLAPHTDHDAACALAERCRLEVGRIAGDAEDGIHVTASFGVATLRPGEEARALLGRDNTALYLAKCEGRDRVVGDRPPLTSA